MRILDEWVSSFAVKDALDFTVFLGLNLLMIGGDFVEPVVYQGDQLKLVLVRPFAERPL